MDMQAYGTEDAKVEAGQGGQESRGRMQGRAIKSTENHDVSVGGLGDQSENDRQWLSGYRTARESEKRPFYHIEYMPCMVLSEKDPEDKQKMKNGVIGVVVLLVLGSLSPLIIEEFTDVDLETLCEKSQNGTDIECLEDGGIKSTVLEGLGYVSIIIAIVGFVGFVIVGVKY